MFKQSLAATVPGILCATFLLCSNLTAYAHNPNQLVSSIEKTRNAVVKIVVSRLRTQSNAEKELREFTDTFEDHYPEIFTPGKRSRQVGAGLLINSNGVFVSSAHLVRGAHSISIEYHSGETTSASVVGVNDHLDIAVLKVSNTPQLDIPPIAPLNSIFVGQPVFAIGAPFGFAGSVTSGIISAIREESGLLQKVTMIQTDVAVNPGNSGGPLFNFEGEVIGITTQIMSTNGGYQGVSFAVPIVRVMSIVNGIINSVDSESPENQ